MPLYEYRCESCGHQFEVIQKFSDALVAVCPKCGAGPVVKLMSSPAIQFKGSGFYITDYGKDGKGPRKAESEKPAAESKSESESTPKPDKADKAGKPDTKPAPKAETKPSKKAASE